MTPGLFTRLLVCGALTVSLAAVSFPAQAPSRTRIHDPEAEGLAKLLTDAQAALERRDFTTAAQKYRDYIEKKPDDAYAHFQLGYAYTALERPADAKTEYAKAAELDPRMGAAYTNLGMTLLDLREPAAAVEPFKKAADLEPTDAQKRFFVGLALERAGRATEALEEYKAAERLDGTSVGIKNALGQALLDTNQPEQAEAYFRASLEEQPNDPEAHLGLARSLTADRKFDDAAAELEAYLKAKPNDARARIERASLLIQLGKYADGLAELDRADAASAGAAAPSGGNEPVGLRELSLRAQALVGEKNYGAAVPFLEKAMALAPNDPEFPAALGHAYIETKKYPEAISVLSAAFKMNPTSSDILGDIATAEFLNKNYQGALQAVDLLGQRKTLPLGSWFLRASCYDKLGQVQQALAAYQTFLHMNTDLNSDMYFIAAARVRALERELKDKKR
jgi:Flp pilus assembly protein TadD